MNIHSASNTNFDPMSTLDMIQNQKQMKTLEAASMIGEAHVHNQDSKSANGSNFLQQADASPAPANANEPVGDSLDTTA